MDKFVGFLFTNAGAVNYHLSEAVCGGLEFDRSCLECKG